MLPKERRESGQNDLFRARLDQIIAMDHALVKLAQRIDWAFLKRPLGRLMRMSPAARRWRPG